MSRLPRETPGRDTAGISHVAFLAVVMAVLLTIGAVGLRLLTAAPWLDCIYMAVITLSTVGFAETVPLDDNPAARIFIMLYLALGLIFVSYGAAHLGRLVIDSSLSNLREKRRMDRKVRELNSHHIICGCGRMGRAIAAHLTERQLPFVIIDRDETILRAACEEHDWTYVVGDATDDEILRRAGIDQATTLATVLPSDADNVYVVLSVRMLAPRLKIIARAEDDKAVLKLERAGATRVVSPFNSGATKMARFMLNPGLEDFLELADTHGNGWQLAEVQLSGACRYIGQSLAQTDLRDKGIMVIGIQRATGEHLMPPPGSAELLQGDSLFAFGSESAINELIARSHPE